MIRSIATTRSTHVPLVALLIVGLTMTGLTMTGCASLSNTEKGAAAGAGAGAVIGGAIGRTQDDTARGAILGAILGGAAGAVVGQQLDEQAAELEDDLEGAEVATVTNPETGETAGIEITFDNAILFDFDSAQLRTGSEQNLNDLAASLDSYPNTDVLIVGHTDATGSADYNQGLSQQRAGSAADFLIGQGIPPQRITTLGKGEGEPIATNETEYGRQRNRRVEVAIFPSEEYREEMQREQGR